MTLTYNNEFRRALNGDTAFETLSEEFRNAVDSIGSEDAFYALKDGYIDPGDFFADDASLAEFNEAFRIVEEFLMDIDSLRY